LIQLDFGVSDPINIHCGDHSNGDHPDAYHQAKGKQIGDRFFALRVFGAVEVIHNGRFQSIRAMAAGSRQRFMISYMLLSDRLPPRVIVSADTGRSVSPNRRRLRIFLPPNAWAKGSVQPGD
jgi:hypothetical protein